MKKLVIFVSGEGSNLQYLINSINNYTLDAKIKTIICNKKNAHAIKRGIKYKIPVIYKPYISKIMDRDKYDTELYNLIKPINPDLIILAGWMHIFSSNFIRNFKIINLHPALPNQFPGSNSIELAYNSFKQGLINHTGIMVHYVIPKIDSGRVIAQKKIKILKKDSLNDLKKRIQNNEKSLLVFAIQKIFMENLYTTNYQQKKNGKVREIYFIDNNLVLFVHTDKLSSFDRHICDVPGKGSLLNLVSTWWFKRTKFIIDNHMLYSENNLLIVKRCDVIPIEFVVRGYITGTTKTSLWTHYNEGKRTYCGLKFEDGLRKNQKLDSPVITPTTKDIEDVPISSHEIINQKILTEDEWDFISKKAIELFEYGQMVAKSKNLILVDTKYEFGRDNNGNIILIDEIHTGDSSRYWVLDSYQERFSNHVEPERLDKDSMRTYLLSVCNPYKVEKIPDIPINKIESLLKGYINLYKKLNNSIPKIVSYNKNMDVNKYIESYINSIHNQLIVILSGSKSDNQFIEKIMKHLQSKNLYYRHHICSAHKQTKQLLNILDKYEIQERSLIYITVAGRSNALSGVVACNTRHPVFACPPLSDKTDFMLNINSSLQCPSNVPVMTVLEPSNLAICCSRIFKMK